MKASDAVKVADKVIDKMMSFAFLAREWEMKDEDDFYSFRDVIIDVIADHEEL